MKVTRFVATEKSLGIAEAVANKLNMTFDKEGTAELTRNLIDLYFSDISIVLPDATSHCHFESFATRDFSAFASPLGADGAISIDQQWSFFLLNANFLASIRTFRVLDEQKQQHISALFLENLKTLLAPHSHETLREKMKPLLFKYSRELLLSNILTKATFGFMICHEMAHINLQHFQQDECPAIELEADKQGLDYLFEVSKHFESLKHLNIPPNFIGAPLLSFIYLSALENAGLVSSEDNRYPPAQKRLEALTMRFNTVANDEAKYLFEGLTKGCQDILNDLKLG